MKKQYIIPALAVVKISKTDIIATSNNAMLGLGYSNLDAEDAFGFCDDGYSESAR